MSLTDQLVPVVSEAVGHAVAVEDLRRLTGGASRETWSFDAVGPGGLRDELILRRDPPAAPRGLAVEAAALRAAAAAGVAVPEVLAHSEDPALLDAPFLIVRRLAGETLARKILRDEAYADVRPRLAADCGRALARIHRIPVADVPGLPASDALDGLREMLHAFADPSPALELGLRWLQTHRPAAVDPVVVHGDFRNGNLMIGPDGIRAVLDWELVHAGDPMQDLGWLCVRAWRFGAPGPVGGFGAYEDLFAGYERESGTPVDRDRVRWWEVFGTVWWGAGCKQMAWRHLSGAERSVELAAIGRRVWEQEYDTLLLLEDVA